MNIDPKIWTAIISAFVSLIIGFIGLIFTRRNILTKLKKEHENIIERIKFETQGTFQKEIDILRVESIKKMTAILKYISMREYNPNAMFYKNKNDFYLNGAIAKKFLNEANSYLYGEHEKLFISKEVKRILYFLVGVIFDILKLENQKDNRILLQNKVVIKKIENYTHGEKDIHKLVNHEFDQLYRNK